MLALFRLGQFDYRSGEHQSVHQLVRGIDVDLFIGVGVDVEARREPADDFAAAIVRGADEELVGFIEERGVDLRLRAADERRLTDRYDSTSVVKGQCLTLRILLRWSRIITNKHSEASLEVPA